MISRILNSVIDRFVKSHLKSFKRYQIEYESLGKSFLNEWGRPLPCLKILGTGAYLSYCGRKIMDIVFDNDEQSHYVRVRLSLEEISGLVCLKGSKCDNLPFCGGLHFIVSYLFYCFLFLRLLL